MDFLTVCSSPERADFVQIGRICALFTVNPYFSFSGPIINNYMHLGCLSMLPKNVVDFANLIELLQRRCTASCKVTVLLLANVVKFTVLLLARRKI